MKEIIKNSKVFLSVLYAFIISTMLAAPTLAEETSTSKTVFDPQAVSVDRIVFSDTNGELAAMPEKSTDVTAGVTLTSNVDYQSPVVIWVAVYKDYVMQSVKAEHMTLEGGESKPVSIEITTSDGSDELRAGVWNAFSLANPYVNAARFPSDEQGIKAIYIDGTKFNEFDENVTEYTYYVDETQITVPQIRAEANNSNTKIIVTQASAIDGNALISAGGKTYTINFAVKAEPGEITNVKWNGKSTTSIYGTPNIGINPPDIYHTYSTDNERIAAARALEDTVYDDAKWTLYNDRVITDIWSGGNAVNQKFIVADTPDKYLYGENVTRLVKPSYDNPEAGFASKTYEFTINKPATVYITVNNELSRAEQEVHSAYIEGLNAGWEFEYDPKYVLKIWNTGVSVTSSDSTDTIWVPNGKTICSYGASGSVYYKHFNSGTVQIPAFSETSSKMQMNVYLVWDSCNEEAKIFDILADGFSISGFDADVTEYEISVEEGSEVPQISVSATNGANATVVQAESLDECATVKACGKTYTIKFRQVAPNMNLSNLCIDGKTIDGFDPEVNEYTYTVERGITEIPVITATAELDTRTVEVTQAAKMPGTATVTVKSVNGAENTYIINIVKTGTPGEVSNFTYGGAAASKIKAIPSLGAPMLDVYNMFETDAERIAYITSEANAYSDEGYAQYSDRASATGTVWSNYTETVSWAPAFNRTYGMHIEFILLDHPGSMLISPDVTRILKPANDPSGSEEIAKNAYTFDISKDATVYITTGAASSFIAEQGWTYANGNKYKLYYPERTAECLATDVTSSDNEDEQKKYVIPNGTAHLIGNAQGHVYYKHFKAEEKVIVPSFAADSSSRKMNIFIVWDDCNDERNLYDVEYSIGESNPVDFGFDTSITEYDITVLQGTGQIPSIDVSATRPVNVQIVSDKEYTDGKATVTMTAELESGNITTYTFNFYVDYSAEEDTRIKSVAFDGTEYESFEMYTKNYEIELAYGVEYPVLSAETNSDKANAVITQPIDNNGVGLISVTSQNGEYTKVYSFSFTKLDYIPLAAEVMKVKDGKDSIVTIVHDDGGLSTVEYLDEQAQRNNLRVTVGMIAKRIANTDGTLRTTEIAKWTPYFESGRFNLASHSFTHTYWGQSDSVAEEESVSSTGDTVPATYAGKMTFEIKTSGEILREAFPNERVLSFIKPGVTYPDGKAQISDESYDMIEENYISMRNTGGGINTIPPSDWYNVRSYMVKADDTAEYWTELVDKNIAQNGWLVFLFHNILDDESATSLNVGKTAATKFLSDLGERVGNDSVWNAFFDEATMYIKESQTAEVIAKDYTTDKGYITVEVSDKLDDSVYNYPLTVKIKVPDSWAYVKSANNGETEIKATFTEDGATYAYVNVVPDSGLAVINQASDADM